MSTSTVYYCYAVARPFSPEQLEGLAGVRKSPVEVVHDDDLVAVVSPVPVEEFGEAELKANLESLPWLEEVARAHNDVVDHVARYTVTLPFRMATMYWDADRVRDVLRADRASLAGALDRVDGRREWGVKVYSLDTSSGARPTTARSGRAYLRQRIENRDTQENSLQQAEECATRVDEILSAHSAGRRQHRPQNPEISGARGHNVFNTAYLVHRHGESEFAQHVEALREQLPQCRIELTGPWVPYSFSFDPVTEAEGG